MIYMRDRKEWKISERNPKGRTQETASTIRMGRKISYTMTKRRVNVIAK